jgi:hypothetical protein
MARRARNELIDYYDDLADAALTYLGAFSLAAIPNGPEGEAIARAYLAAASGQFEAFREARDRAGQLPRTDLEAVRAGARDISLYLARRGIDSVKAFTSIARDYDVSSITAALAQDASCGGFGDWPETPGTGTI